MQPLFYFTYFKKLPVCFFVAPKIIKGANDVHQLLLAYMQVTLGGFKAKIAQQVFYVFYIGSFIKQMRGKTVP